MDTLPQTAGGATAKILQLLGQCDLVDCTHTINNTIPVWPGSSRLLRCPFATHAKDGYNKEVWVMGEDLGTHMDSPYHFHSDGRSIDQIQMTELVTPGVVVDCQEAVQKNPDYELSVDDLKKWEAEFGQIPVGALVCMKSGWASRWPNEAEYQNMDSQGVMHFPGFSEAAARWLCTERNISGIGIDTLSLDPGPSPDFAVHKRVPQSGAIFVALPMKMERAPEAETRVLAIVPK